MVVDPPVARSVTVMSTGAVGGAARAGGNKDKGGAMATMVLAVQLETTAAMPLTVTGLPGRKPMPVMVMRPPLTLVTAGWAEFAETVSA